ncbi:MAG: hypothetical protein ACXV0U_01595 [Kineosporiaceae bacterium]
MPVSYRSARFVAWSNAVLGGHASPDLAAVEITGGDGPHRVDGLPGGQAQTLPVVLARLATHGRPQVRLVLPVPGDPTGLPGPGPFTTAALGAGEAVRLPSGWGLVPSEEGSGVRWLALPTDDDTWPPPGAPAPGLAEADRALAETLRQATEVLDRLDVARLDADRAEDLARLRSGRLDGDGLAPGYPERAVSVLVRARRLRTIVRLAARDEGGTVTAAEARDRLEALRPLDRAARHAEMAAYNVLSEPGSAGRS